MKLIITDLDNTLLRSDKSISEYTANVFVIQTQNNDKLSEANYES